MAPPASDEMIALVEALLDSEELRAEFHTRPIQVIDDFEIEEEEDVAVLFTMNRNEIGAWTGLTERIQAYQMESDWEAQGPDWADPASNEPTYPDFSEIVWSDAANSNVCDAVRGGVEPTRCVTPQGPTTRGGWGDPLPHGRGFRKAGFEQSELSNQNTISIVGEGLLGSACVSILPARGQQNDPVHVQVARVGFANFRRVYLETRPFDGTVLSPGLHYVRIRNHQSVCAITGGHLLEIKAPTTGSQQ